MKNGNLILSSKVSSFFFVLFLSRLYLPLLPFHLSFSLSLALNTQLHGQDIVEISRGNGK